MLVKVLIYYNFASLSMIEEYQPGDELYLVGTDKREISESLIDDVFLLHQNLDDDSICRPMPRSMSVGDVVVIIPVDDPRDPLETARAYAIANLGHKSIDIGPLSEVINRDG